MLVKEKKRVEVQPEFDEIGRKKRRAEAAASASYILRGFSF
eukprot:SAG22_NODE_298_length_12785_cov_5.760129_6_plen_41_part_00